MQGRFLEIEDLIAATRPAGFERWPGDRMIDFHMAAVRQQLSQARTAVILGTAGA